MKVFNVPVRLIMETIVKTSYIVKIGLIKSDTIPSNIDLRK